MFKKCFHPTPKITICPEDFLRIIRFSQISQPKSLAMKHRLECAEFTVVVKDSHNNSSLYLSQHIGEQLIVMLHTVVKVDLNILVGEVVNLFFVLLQLCCLILKLLL